MGRELKRVPKRNRQVIDIGPSLQALLKGRKEPLSKAVNMIAERYTAMIERASYNKHTPIPMMSFHLDLYRNTLKELEGPLSPAEIMCFPTHVEDWMSRNPDFPPGPAGTALVIVKNCKFHELVALIDYLERIA